ncbi:sulfotransferase family 2 domain-containing protein [Pelagicoccus sp. SDUM812005]|nr:sulfotransferase family 2 domain-containing protein [Pelagicoccus sp. SDUM812005]MDQ8182369.1 sulfotransferase family 2 domain-containing protein [Pelagicoccus sp. SDUM812005]
MVYSVHIPKCGGTSFRIWLQSSFSGAVLFDYSKRWERSDADALTERLFGKDCFHAHGAVDALDDCPFSVTKVTWLRHPVDRVISYYNHILRFGDQGNGYFRTVLEKEMGLLDFARLDWMRDGMTKYLCGKEQEFRFVGILEKSQQCMPMLCSALKMEQGFGRAVFDLPLENSSRDICGYGATEASVSVREEIERCNVNDLALYNAQLARLGLG